MIRQPTLEELEDAWMAVDDSVPTESQRLRAWAFREILEGRHPTLAQAADALKFTATEGANALHVLKEAGLATAAGSTITGSMGLTHETTPHELVLDGRPFHVWCALDAIGIPAALGRPARVESHTADEGRDVSLTYDGKAWQPADRVEVLVALPGASDCISEEICPTINFYARGKAPRHPRAAALSLEEAAALGKKLWGRYA